MGSPPRFKVLQNRHLVRTTTHIKLTIAARPVCWHRPAVETALPFGIFCTRTQRPISSIPWLQLKGGISNLNTDNTEGLTVQSILLCMHLCPNQSFQFPGSWTCRQQINAFR
jgi:hypothetical protein